MGLEEYNSIQENLHLMSTPANRRRLDDAIHELESGQHSRHSLIEN